MQEDSPEIFTLMRAHSLWLHGPISVLDRVQTARGFQAS